MEISELTLRLVIVFIPGIISTLIIESLTVHKKWEAFKYALYSFLLGFLSYFILQIFFFVINLVCISFIDSDCDYSVLQFWVFLTEHKQLPYIETLGASIIAVFLGLIITALIEHKIASRVARRFNLSYKFGDESLYYFFLGSDEVDAVYIRDIKNNLTYHGYIDKYSEDDKIREIVLREVDVYKYEDSALLYTVPRLYLSRLITDDFIIETQVNN